MSRCTAPAVVPRVHSADAVPSVPVATESKLTVPPPSVTEKVTVSPATPLARASRILTTIGAARVVATVAVCSSPDALKISVPTWETITSDERESNPADAVARPVPIPTAVTTPLASTVNTLWSLAWKVTAESKTFPNASRTVAVRDWVSPSALSVTVEGMSVMEAGTCSTGLVLSPHA